MGVLVTDVIATQLLDRRSEDGAHAAPSARVHQKEMGGANQLKQLCEQVRASCHAESAGISVFHHPTYAELTWHTVVGACASLQGSRYPLRHSMCGVCFDAGTPQLFQEPHLYFQWMGLCGLRVAEGLVVPMRTPAGTLFGTIWCLTHQSGRREFTTGDTHRMQATVSDIYSELCLHTHALASMADAQTGPGPSFQVERRLAGKP